MVGGSWVDCWYTPYIYPHPLDVDSVTPTLSSISSSTGNDGTGPTLETLTGTNLGGTTCLVFVSGSGVTVTSPTCVNATTITANFTIASNAPPGVRAVTATIDGGAPTNALDFTVIDATPPVPGGGGTITTSGITTTNITLNWTKATDNITPQNQLQYEVCRSLSNNVTTINQCEAATIIQSFTTDIATVNATGLVPGTTYYFNVVVKDVAGNKAIYNPVNGTTTSTSNPTPGTGPTISNITTFSFKATWGAATGGTPPYDYILYRSFSNNLDTVANTLANGVPVCSGTGILTCDAIGLTPNSTYYANVLVRDSVGNASMYTTAMAVLLASTLASAGKTQGWCQDGNYTVTIPGNSQGSPNKYQRSFPQCTVTVYVAGTVQLASIYSDATGTTKANPFTSATSGQWFFYANNGRYDVKFSGSGIASPFTLGDNSIFDERSTIGYNVKTYGATGLGVVSDDTAFTNAIIAARADSKALYIPAGTYRLTSSPFNFINNGNQNDSGFTVNCETTNDRWDSGIYTTRIDYRGTGQLFSFTATGNNNLSSITFNGCQFDGRNIAPGSNVDGILMSAATGNRVNGIRFNNTAFTNFPRYMMFLNGTVFDITVNGSTLENPFNAGNDLFHVESSVAGQITFNDSWLAQYATGKWAINCGRTVALPTNGCSDIRIKGGSIINGEATNDASHGGNGVWSYGFVSIDDVHGEDACECAGHTHTIGLRVTGSSAPQIKPSTWSFWGRGIEIGNSGYEIGGSALTTTESVGTTIEGNVGFNNNCVTCADIYVVGGSGVRSGTHIDVNTSLTSGGGNFGTASGEPNIVIDTVGNATNANNVFRITRTSVSGGYPSIGSPSTGGSLFFDNVNGRVAVGNGSFAPTLKFNVQAGTNDGIRGVDNSNGNTAWQIINDGTRFGAFEMFNANTGTITTHISGNSAGSSYIPTMLQVTGLNFVLSETGANNAIIGSLSNVTLAAGTCLYIRLAHTLQAGANTFNFNSGGAAAIKSSRSLGNIGTPYSVGGVPHLCYDGTQWLDMSQ
jgi:hypothetical protein